MRKFQPDLVDRTGENGYHRGTLANPAPAASRRYITMKLGEKLQQLRRQSGLSQEQLAAQLTVSRQAVSKWELDETMPDTENVIQLSRLFGVSCDYLLRDEVDEQGAALPDPQTKEQASSNVPEAGGESAVHLTQQGWIHNATILSLAVCALGLLLALGGWLHEQTSISLIIGLAIQILGIVLFELAVPRMGGERKTARLTFYMAANWLVLPIPTAELCWWGYNYALHYSLPTWDVFIPCDLAFSTAVTAILGWLRWQQTHKK